MIARTTCPNLFLHSEIEHLKNCTQHMQEYNNQQGMNNISPINNITEMALRTMERDKKSRIFRFIAMQPHMEITCIGPTI